MADYTEDELDAAFLQDEVARYGLEALRLTAAADPASTPAWKRARAGLPPGPRGDRPAHDITWDEPPATSHAGYQDHEAAYFKFVRELADRTGNALQDVLELSQALATGNSLEEKASALICLADAFESVGGAPVPLTPGILELTVSASERRALAGEGKALGPEGDFPIPDKGHLVSAIARFKQGRLAGHSKSAVRDHIAKNAKRLGVQVDFGDDDADHDDDEQHEAREHQARTRRQPPRRRAQGGHPGVDGSDSFHSAEGPGGFDVGGPSGNGPGAGVSMAAHLARIARAGGGFSGGDVLRLTAQRTDDPDQRAELLHAAELRDMMDKQEMSASEGEIARLTRSYFPQAFGIDPAFAELSARTPAERDADAEADRLIGEHWDLFPMSKVHDVSRGTAGKAHPSRPGKVSTKTRAHAGDREDASADHHALVQKYLADVQRMNGRRPSPDKPFGNSHSYGPKPSQHRANC